MKHYLNKEIWYATQEDQLLFYNDIANTQIRRFKLSGGISLRPRLLATHSLQLSYFDNEISLFDFPNNAGSFEGFIFSVASKSRNADLKSPVS